MNTNSDRMDLGMPMSNKPTSDKLSQIGEEVASATSLSIDSVETIPITQLDKYIITCEISGPIEAGNFQKIRKLAQNLDRWWNSDSKFFVLISNDNVPKIRFERLENSDEDSNEL